MKIHSTSTWITRLVVAAMCLHLTYIPKGDATPDQLWEDYALAADQAQWIASLPEGSQQRTYFEILHAQSSGDLNRSAKLLKRETAGGETPQHLRDLSDRQALLTLTDQSSQALWSRVRDLAGLNLSATAYQPPARGGDAQVDETRAAKRAQESQLTAEEVSQELKRHEDRHRVYDLSPGAARQRLAKTQWGETLSEREQTELISLLNKLSYLPSKELIDLIRRLPTERWESLSLLEQLSDQELRSLLATNKLSLSARQRLFNRLITLTSRSAEVGFDAYQLTAQELDEYLTQLDALTSLAPDANQSYKAHLLLAELSAAERRGEWPLKPLLSYLEIPQDYQHYERIYEASLSGDPAEVQEPYVNTYKHPKRLQSSVIAQYQSMTGLSLNEPPSVLVARHIEHHLKRPRDQKQFSAQLDEQLLQRMWAKRHILTGGDVTSRALKRYVKSDDYRKLTELKLLRFSSDRARHVKRDQEVKLNLRLRGHSELILKVYTLNTRAYWSQNSAEIPLDLDLSGLEANEERRVRIERPELLETTALNFPKLSAPGVYVIDIQAGEEKIRAFIRKGHLTPYLVDSVSGPELLVIDDLGEIARDVEVNLDGRAYRADVEGRIRLPYSESGRAGTLLVTQGDLTVRSQLSLPREEYKLAMSVAAPQLRGGAENRLKVSARLTLNGRPMSLKLLKSQMLTLKVIDADGTPQSRTITAPTFDQAGELILPAQLPLGLRELSVSLSGQLKSLTRGEEQTLSAKTSTLYRNRDLASRNVGDVIFVPGGSPPRLEVIGRNGEALIGVPTTITLSPRMFRRSISFSKRSDERGYITLPSDLSAFSKLDAEIKAEKSRRARAHSWWLSETSIGLTRDLTIRAEAQTRFMWSGSSEVYLRHARSRRILMDAVSVEGEVMTLKPLNAGRYELIDMSRQTMTRVQAFSRSAQLKHQLWFSAQGITPHTPPSSLILEQPQAQGDSLEVKLRASSKRARLHIIATPFARDDDYTPTLRPLDAPSRPSLSFSIPESGYGVGQILSEEMQYILKRRESQRSAPRVGNLAESPSLLVNRADQGEALSVDRAMGLGQSMRGYGGGGSGYGSKRKSRKRPRGRYKSDAVMTADRSLRTWDFLSRGALTRWSVPVEGDSATISLKDLRGAGRVYLTLTDGRQRVSRVINLEATDAERKSWLERVDLRVAQTPHTPQALSVTRREQRALKAGDALTLPDLSSRWKSYETLSAVYEVYERLLPSAQLDRLKPLLKWPSMTDAEKLAFYLKRGSHEVDLFLFHKDPAFFKSHISPLLKEKGYLSFLEQWMLKRDLSAYLAPRRFESLNLFEQILLLKGVTQSQSRETGRANQRERRESLLRYLEQRLKAEPTPKTRLYSLFQAAIAQSLEQAPPPPPRAEGSSIEISVGAAAPASAFAPMPSMDKMAGEAEAEDEMFAEPEPDEVQRRRNQAPQLYRSEGATHQWIERRYFDHATPTASLIKINRFWLDYASHDEQSGPFLSPHLLEATTNFNAAWIALALLDLPFEAEAPSAHIADGKLKITAKASGVYFYEGAVNQPLPTEQDISIRREYWSLYDNGMMAESGPKELRAGIPYQVKLMVMNPTNRAVEYELSHPAPDGSILLVLDRGGRSLTPQTLKLAPHEIKVSGYTVYFPHVGTYQHSPAYVTREGELVGVGDPSAVKVVRELTQLNQESWSDVARLGSHAEVMRFLRKRNPREVDLKAVYNRLPDPEFYRPLIKLLDELRIFDQTVWSYALQHRDLKRTRELLTLNARLRQRLGPFATFGDGERVDSYAQLEAQHFDFDPLTVARAHSRGKVDAMTHAEMKRRYLTLLRYLAHKPRAGWSLYDHLGVAYYLVKQGRIDDAVSAFKGATAIAQRTSQRRGDSAGHLYYDYLRAYLALSQGDVKGAQEIARTHEAVSHPAWRDRFKSIYAPEALIEDTAENEASEAASGSLTESLDFKMEGAALVISAYQVDEVEVRLYPINLEILFSNNPLSLEGQRVSVSPLIKPSFTQVVKLSKTGETRFELPETWRQRALQVEVKRGVMSQVRSYAPQSFKQHIFKQRGLMRLSDASAPHAPLSGAYVKVYAKLKSGEVRFYKDGYTDHRGIFDYVNANPAPGLPSIERFMILTLTQSRGSSVKSVAPPAN